MKEHLLQLKKKLVEVSVFFSFFRLFVEAQNFVDDFHVGKQHSPAAVSFDS